ncbi:MAG: methenyltetrahydromethanopterin cyclohydrolase [Planctomycetota bacterium]|nr:MAG: methenyltetrahydromethanopterin cyclohydrolase [Planctomycetota bacterium]
MGGHVERLSFRALVVDFGLQAPGGLGAGLELAAICTSGLASIDAIPGDRSVWPGAWIAVATDQPPAACMLSQYAGWPIRHGEDFVGMGSGPMRLLRGQEKLLTEFNVTECADQAVGVIETERLPDDELARRIANECRVSPERLTLAVAPTRSMAGCVQIVARSVETCLHKLHELGLPFSSVRSAWGVAPLCPPAPDFVQAIGRTNDAILYGAHVTLWMDAADEVLESAAGGLPSCASRDFGRPFAEVFQEYDFDFYRIDPHLFSPAEVLLINARTGSSFRGGGVRSDLVQQSFGVRAVGNPLADDQPTAGAGQGGSPDGRSAPGGSSA